MRSARRVFLAGSAMLPFSAVLTGCVSTQQIAARARLVSERTLASQAGTRVLRANHDLSIGGVVMIHGQTGTAIVVPLRNNTSRTLTDLPISIGLRTRTHQTIYLNRSTTLDYFESHIAAIGAHGRATWVFTTPRRVTGGRPFATVGFTQLHPAVGHGLPSIEVSAHGTAGASVTNRSAIPQYDLPVYAVAVRAGHVVAAGRAAVPHLGTHSSATVSLTLLGSDRQAHLRLIALPTILN